MKQKFILITCFLIILGASSYAQDTIVRVDGSKILSKIIEISSKSVKYKDFSYLDGPDYVLENEEISEIHFINGNVKKYNPILNEENVEYINDKPVLKKDNNLSYEKEKEWPIRQRRFESGQTESYQVQPGQKYKLNKQLYDYRMYSRQYGDPYDPILAGVASYFLPGLGQMVSGETGRGFAFLGGVFGSYVVGAIGINMAIYSSSGYYYSNYFNNGAALTGTLLGVAGMAGGLGLHIYSIVDAVRVAKVNNMYQQDLRESHVSMKILPFVGTPDKFSLIRENAYGLTLSLNF